MEGAKLKGHLLMSERERERMKVLARVKKGEMKLVEAADLLKLSYRHVKRVYGRYREQGDQGLIHQARGRQSNRGIRKVFKQEVIDLYQKRYPDFGPTLAVEKLAEQGYKLDHETLRRWLLKQGLWHKRRRRPIHRSWRQRRAHFGELVQIDGSHHGWFEKRAEPCCLMNLVDDATGLTLSSFAAQETTEAAMLLLWAWIGKYGIPAAVYADRKNVYIPEEKARQRARQQGLERYTQFGRACARLGIEIITAYSPQAKGRVERSHGVYQDRLVKELRLQKISGIGDANQLLADGFIDHLNRKFAVKARSETDFHRSSKGYDLVSVFCLEEERALTEDWIVRFKGSFYQLRRQSRKPPTTRKVLVRQCFNGELRFNYRGRDVLYTELPARPQPPPKAQPLKLRASTKKYIPPADHPWRHFRFGSQARPAAKSGANEKTR